ncbi:hypothetical protein [Acanthopleuribacter pedis]|uniref:Uncharacterized protein n=1 Tax=Acanthopleuribacter pedis TaxID=442870 RepID=A0A8J7QH08_9BACT|nr:hypothetical protein [Acanthopleuribacter pedis]MBO1320201.1 hypothetical protein [Acanthopleuribacter pedis]
MEPLEDTLVYQGGEIPLQAPSEETHVYTHAQKTRLLILVIFLSYLVVFSYFTSYVVQKLSEPDSLPPFLWIAGDPNVTYWFYFAVFGAGFLIAFGIFMYFLYSVVDIWGLEVWVNQQEVRVVNTLTGPYFRRFTGVGRLSMEDIVRLRPTTTATFVLGKSGVIRFTPVDQVETLIQTIIMHAQDVTIDD